MPYVSNGQLDAAILAAMGYRQQLARGFRNWAMSGALTFLAIGTVPYMGLDLVVTKGGPLTALYSWIATVIFSFLTVCSLGEIVSSFPNAGAMYHWVGQLVPAKWSPFVSFATGMLLFFGTVTNVATSASCTARWILTMAAVQGLPKVSDGAAIGLMIAIIFAWSAFNVQRVTSLAWCLAAFAACQLAVAVVIVVTMYASSTPTGGAAMWTQWDNKSGFSGVDGYVFLLGLSANIYTLSGYDASAHVAEETLLAHWSVPFGMLAAVVASGFVGFWILIALLYYVPPAAFLIASSSSSSDTAFVVRRSGGPSSLSSSTDIAPVPTLAFHGYAALLASIFSEATGSTKGTVGLAALISVCTFFSGAAVMTVASRLAFALARDGALPLSEHVRYLHRSSESPVGAIGLVCGLAMVVVLFGLGSTTAFNAVVNPYVFCLQVAYAIPLILRFTVARSTFRRGPFHLGRLSEPCAWVSVAWLLGTAVIYLWPTTAPVSLDNMNWAVCALACAAALSAIWWFSWARLNFAGPRLRRGDIAPMDRPVRGRRTSRIMPLNSDPLPPPKSGEVRLESLAMIEAPTASVAAAGSDVNTSVTGTDSASVRYAAAESEPRTLLRPSDGSAAGASAAAASSAAPPPPLHAPAAMLMKVESLRDGDTQPL